MVKKSSRIFRSKFGDISARIDNPGPIAEKFFEKGLIGKSSLHRAHVNTVPAFDRTGPLLRAVYAAVDTDTEEPVIFNKLCDVLMSFSETEATGIAMYTEYHGVSPRSPSPPPPQRSVSFKIEGDLFRSVSDRLKVSISSNPVAVSMSLRARNLITFQLHQEMLEGLDSSSNKAAKLVDVLQISLDAHSNPEAYLQEVCSALKKNGQKQIVDIVNELERTLSSSSASVPTDKPEDTPSAIDRIQSPPPDWPYDDEIMKRVPEITDFHEDLVKDIEILLMPATTGEEGPFLYYLKQSSEKVIETYIDGLRMCIGHYGKSKIIVIMTAPTKSRQGPIHANAITFKMLEKVPSIKYVVAVGVCFGMYPEKLNLGDVVISDMICDFTNKREEGVTFYGYQRGPQYKVMPAILHKFRPPHGFEMPHNIKVSTGVLISIGSHINNPDVKQKLLESRRDAIAGEMEGAGIMTAIGYATERGVSAIVIKGICDWGDGDKEATKGWKPFAARAAAHYVHAALNEWQQLEFQYGMSTFGTGTRATPTEDDEINKERIKKWLEEGEVELKVTRINMHGAPGAGKTCSQHLLLNEPPPEKLTDSTPIACRAVKATRISIDGLNNKWKKVELEDLLNQLASTEVDKAPKPEDDESSLEEPTETTENQSPENEATKIEPINPTENERSESKPIENKQAENKTTEMKSTKQKPAKNKSTNAKLVNNMLLAFKTGESKKLSTNWVYFIDSGGQPAYRELLPLFTRAAALNIITIDLTKGLDDKHEFQYRISQRTSPVHTDLKFSNGDIIRSTISSEAMLNSVTFPYVSDMPKHSHYLILGTREELVSEKKLKEMNESLREYIANNQVIKKNERKGLIIFPVNTLLSADSIKREEASAELCTAISNCRVEMTIKLPIRLFAFEICLQREAKDKNRSFLTKEEVIEIGKSLELDTESDIDDALKYLHNVTIILYYCDVDALKDLIFVDPEPILAVLSHLIAITYVDHGESCNVSGEKSNFVKFGLFKKALLEETARKQQNFNKDFQSSHIIELLMHLHIITKVENRDEGDYFFPCALPSRDKPSPPSKKVQPLLIAWKIDNSGTTTLAIPQGLFPLTIVHLLERKKDEVDFFPPGNNNYYRYLDAMSLFIYDEHLVHIINCYTHIEIHFPDGRKDSCQEIRELVTGAIKNSCKDLNCKDDHIFAFKCPKEEKCYCIIEEDKSSTRCTQCRPHCKVLQGDDDSYRCWFSDFQSSSPVEVPAHSEEVQDNQSNPIKNPASDKDDPTRCSILQFLSMFMIFLAVGVLAGMAINHFLVEKNTNNIEKFLTIIGTGALQAQPHHDSTTVNPYSDGAGQLGIEDIDKVLTVLHKALFGPAEWYNLGLKLGLLVPTTLNVIEDDGGNAPKKLKKTIEAWLRGEDNARSRTWLTLIDAVRKTEDRAAAERIPKELISLYGINL